MGQGRGRKGRRDEDTVYSEDTDEYIEFRPSYFRLAIALWIVLSLAAVSGLSSGAAYLYYASPAPPYEGQPKPIDRENLIDSDPTFITENVDAHSSAEQLREDFRHPSTNIELKLFPHPKDSTMLIPFLIGKANNPTAEVIVFIHGFPDNFHSFKHQMEFFHRQGMTVIAPMLRGYHPKYQPADGDLSIHAAAADIIVLMDLFEVKQFHVIGHDWGSLVAGLLAKRDVRYRIRSVTRISVPEEKKFLFASALVPTQFLNSWYFFFFQLPFFPERWLLEHNGIEKLWSDWSFRYSSKRLESVKAVLSAPGVITSAVNYYRQNLIYTLPCKVMLTERAKERCLEIQPRINIPTMYITGKEDGCIDHRLFEYSIRREDHRGGYTIRKVPNAGHFVHQEAPAEVNTLLDEWINKHTQLHNRREEYKDY